MNVIVIDLSEMEANKLLMGEAKGLDVFKKLDTSRWQLKDDIIKIILPKQVKLVTPSFFIGFFSNVKTKPNVEVIDASLGTRLNLKYTLNRLTFDK